MGRILAVVAALMAFCAFADGEITSYQEIRKMALAEAVTGRAVMLNGVVTFVRADGFVLAPRHERDQNAVFVVRTGGTIGPTEVCEGDTFRVEGRTCAWENIAAIEAHSLVRTGQEHMEYPTVPKWYDVRMGWRNLRRGRIHGRVAAVDYVLRPSDGHPETVVTLSNWEGKISVHIAGRVASSVARVGNTIEAVGITRNIFDTDGNILASIFEVATPEGVSVLATSNERVVEAFLAALGVLAFFAAVGFCAAWLSSRRKRKEMKLLANDRKRIAADLHDTIEQHLSGARILLDGAANVAGIPEAALKRIKMACEVLANAKSEVREAVTGLRSDASGDASLKDAMRKLADGVNRLGQANVTLDCDKMLDASEMRRGDENISALLVIRESVTNAIKHGKAKNIRIAGDTSAIRISNDGIPFDPAEALGPETGHFGLSSMRERCTRHGWKLEFGRNGEWSYVEFSREAAK